MNTFTITSLSPLWLAAGNAAELLPLAAVRGGGVGLLDAEFCPAAALPAAAATLHRLRAALPPASAQTPAIGLRLAAEQRESHGALLAALAGQPHHLILCGWAAPTLPADLAALAAPGRQIWLEAGAVAATAEVDSEHFTGWVARGAECGGRSGAEAAFILAQHFARQARPFWVCGGVGPHTAAACRVAGAAGVILDDALLLLRESPLSPHWRSLLAQVNSQETAVVQGRRVVVRPGFAAAGRRAGLPDDAPLPVGWDDPATTAWPVGQSVGWAAAFAARYGTVGRTVQAMRQASAAQVAAAAATAPLAPGARLAHAHGARYPIVQGPMTRVSDRAEFAAAVAASGALPLLAVAQLSGAETAQLLAATRQLLAGQPWGVGLLGFLPPELRAEQMDAVLAAKPPFALIAGGRPDQAAPLEAAGIPTYLHAPTPELLRLYLGQGARRFVFEGAECGGHTGPLNSFPLWESMVDLLLHEAPAAAVAEMQILFAGGIHDARSAAMIAALAAPLADRGAALGVLMGTAYLFTAEAVAAGAIVPAMQEQALTCRTTVTLETGPGHLIRCAPTPFTAAFAAERARLRGAHVGEAAVTAALEQLLRGRLRIASKGLVRAGQELRPAGAAEQLAEGMYMMGEVAALRSAAGAAAALTTCAALHRAVAEESQHLLAEAVIDEAAPRPSPLAPASIAIVGVGCLLPGAQEPETLWRNLLDQVVLTREIPVERWDWRLLYDPDKTAPDKIYSKWGGFIEPLPFDPLHYGIPPKSLPFIAVTQLLALEATRRALHDAGYGDAIDDARLRSRTAVFFGAGNTGDIEQMYMVRSALPLVVPEAGDAATSAALFARLPTWSEESYPGILGNVIAGRVANRFDLGGPNLTVDAACASSLAALDLAVRELESGRADLVLTGGIEFEQTPQAYMAFSKTQALSPTGQARVFDQSGDGIVISEGAVVLVLKRLADAERDGDRIYAVIRSVAGSSDGKGFGLTAPKPAGQRRAFDRAHALAGSNPASLALYEAHATGTAVGDRSELEMISGALRDAHAPPGACAIGSAKSLIGHTRGAAGVLGVLKAALALHHRVLPPHLGATTPLAPLAATGSPLYLLDQPRPWLDQPANSPPRLAGVSAFGFGGANFHAVLAEYRGALAGAEPYGAAQWPCELIVASAADRGGIQRRVAGLLRWLDAAAPASPRLRDLAYTCAAAADPAQPARLALVARDLADLRGQLAAVLTHLTAGDSLPAGIMLTPGDGDAAPAPALAFLFPGQGSQYPGMGSELALYFGELRGALAAADAVCADLPAQLSRLLAPPAAFTDAARAAQTQALADTAVAQPAIAAVSTGLLDLAVRVGLTPARVAGHSFGEFVALHAAGALDRRGLLRLAATRGRIMASLSEGQGARSEEPEATSQFTILDPGTMAVAFLSRAALAPYLAEFPDVTIANVNAPEQCALSGPTAAIAAIRARLQADGHTVHPLPVSAAFHSPLMQPARAPFAAFLAEEISVAAPALPVHANLDGAPYPADPAQIRDRWVAHLERCVDFVAQVEQMYAAGVRTFVELGPGRVLTGLVHRILRDRPHRAVAADGAGRTAQGGLAAWLAALAELFVDGQPLHCAALFDARPVQWLDLDKPPAAAPAPRWMIDGGRVWSVGATEHLLGAAPLLTQESSAAARRAGLAANAPLARDHAAEDAIGQVYREYQETMRQFLAQQERLIAQILAGGAPQPAFGAPFSGAEPGPRLEPLPAASPPAPAAAPDPPAAPPAADDAPPDRAELTRRLLALVSERTGYPVDMLDPAKDLEAELGVDSIKRIEILGRLPGILPDAAAQRVQAQMDRFTGLRSLAGLTDALMQELDALPRRTAPPRAEPQSAEPPVARPPALSVPSPAQNGAPAATATCPRYVMRGVPRALRTGRDAAASFYGGLVIVTEDALGVGRHVCTLLEQQGAHAFLIQRSDLLDPERLERRVMSLLYLHGSLRGVVHLAALGLPANAENLDAWHTNTALTTKGFFHLLQLCALGFADAAEPVQILAVSQLGGDWGRTVATAGGTAAAGSAHGMLRTLESEYPRVLGKTVDFDATLAPPAMAQIVVDELLTDDGGYEIGYPGGVRTQFWAAHAPLDRAAPRDWRPRAGWVVLVTGGARGITAEICRELAQPGVHLAIVGREPAPGETAHRLPELPEAAEVDLAMLRSQLIAAMRAQGSERTPAEIENEARALLREHERRRNLAALAAAGAQVKYHAVDVRSPAAFGGLIDDLYRRFGRIDAVVHGAGIIEDRQIEEKTMASFERVFDTKADSAYLLGRHLRPAGLRWVVFFSSVAGRFGNQGQVDYAAANEVVNRLACQFDAQWPATRVAAINWGPWRGAGMATQGIQRQFVAKGISAIDAGDGRRFFVDELTYGQKGEVEIVAGEGPWKVDSDQQLSSLLELGALFLGRRELNDLSQ